MSKFTFNGDNTQELLASAKGKSPEKKLSKLEKLAKEKAQKKARIKTKCRHSLYLDQEIMHKLYTVSIKEGISVNDLILDSISDLVKGTEIDEESVLTYIENNMKKGKKKSTEEVSTESINRTND